MAKLKVAIIHPWEGAKFTEPIQWDGLHAALKIVGKKHQVDWFLAGDEPHDSYDWVIPWGVGSIPFNNTIEKYKGRKALLCAGHPQDTANFEKFEAIFVESPAVAKQILHSKVVLAFGTDLEFFRPANTDDKKIFDVFLPATYSTWKRQDLFAEATKGLKALTCGVIQPDGVELFKRCQDTGGYTLAGIVPTVLVAKLYQLSRVVCITAWHGSERTTLEAMACNIPLVITKDNELACSLTTDEVIKVDPTPDAVRNGIQEVFERYYLQRHPQQLNTRKDVIDNYSETDYARKILEVIES